MTLDLFASDVPENCLPHDGTVVYYGKIMDNESAENYFSLLMNNIEWRNDEAIMFGKHIITKRKVAWYGDDNFPYTYSKITRQSLIWTKELLELKQKVEEITGATYNSCLMNLYHTGEEGVAWHSDDEKTLLENGAIASLSFGAERKFSFKHKTKTDAISILLEKGSLLVMKDATQKNWLHCLPKSKKVTQARISLTFRTMVNK